MFRHRDERCVDGAVGFLQPLKGIVAARWGLARSRAYQYIEAAEAAENVSNWTQTLPANEAQVRPLTRLEAPEQPVAWERAQEIARDEGKPLAGVPPKETFPPPGQGRLDVPPGEHQEQKGGTAPSGEAGRDAEECGQTPRQRAEGREHQHVGNRVPDHRLA